MSDAPTPDDAPVPPASAEEDPTLEEVALVVPAAPYVSVLTSETVGPEPESDPILAVLAPESEPPTAPPELLEALRTLGDDLGRRLDGLKSLFEREVRSDSTREKVIDRLHAELQEYKGDLLMKVLRPVFLDLIQLHDDIGKMITASPEAEGEALRLLRVMSGFQQGVEDILYRQGVEPFTVDEPAFDPRRQRAVATVPTADPSLNKTISTRHRPGFRSGDKVIRPEVVSVYALKR